MLNLHYQDDKQNNRHMSLSKPLVIGRALDCDIVLKDLLSSRMHVRFYMEEGEYIVEDLGSSNGSFLNGRRLLERTVVQNGDVLSIGQSKFYVRAPESMPPETETLGGTRRSVSFTPSFVTPEQLRQTIENLWDTTIVPPLSVLKGMGLQQKWFQTSSRIVLDLDEQLDALWTFVEGYMAAQAMVVWSVDGRNCTQIHFVDKSDGNDVVVTPSEQILDYLLQQRVSFSFAQVDVEEVLTLSSRLFNACTTVLAVPVFHETEIIGIVMVLQDHHVDGALEGLNLIVQHIGQAGSSGNTECNPDLNEMLRVVAASQSNQFPYGVFSAEGYLQWFAEQLNLDEESIARLDIVASLLTCVDNLIATPTLLSNAVLSSKDWTLIHRYHRAIHTNDVDVLDLELQVLIAIEILFAVESVEIENERVKMFHQRASGMLSDSLLQKILGDFSSFSRIRDAYSTANDDTTIRGI